MVRKVFIDIRALVGSCEFGIPMFLHSLQSHVQDRYCYCHFMMDNQYLYVLVVNVNCIALFWVCTNIRFLSFISIFLSDIFLVLTEFLLHFYFNPDVSII